MNVGPGPYPQAPQQPRTEDDDRYGLLEAHDPGGISIDLGQPAQADVRAAIEDG